MVENYTKDIKESVYHGAVVSALAVDYTMLGKTLIKMSPPSLIKFDIEDSVKSPHIRSVQYCGGCSVHWKLFSTSGGITSVL